VRLQLGWEHLLVGVVEPAELAVDLDPVVAAVQEAADSLAEEEPVAGSQVGLQVVAGSQADLLVVVGRGVGLLVVVGRVVVHLEVPHIQVVGMGVPRILVVGVGVAGSPLEPLDSPERLVEHHILLELLGSLLQVVERLDTQAAVDRDKRHLVELRILAERGNLDLHQILVLLLVVERHNLVVRRTLLGKDLQNLNLLRLELDSLAEVDSLELRGQRRLEHRYLGKVVHQD